MERGAENSIVQKSFAIIIRVPLGCSGITIAILFYDGEYRIVRKQNTKPIEEHSSSAHDYL